MSEQVYTSIRPELVDWKGTTGTLTIKQQRGITEDGKQLHRTEDITKYIKSGDTILNKNSIEKLIFNDSNTDTQKKITSILMNAHKNYENLIEIDFSEAEKLTEINYAAFQNCSKLTTITFPPYLKVIGNSAFKNCTVLDNLKFTDNESLERINDNSFQNCQNLKILDFTDNINLKFIYNNAFDTCENLTQITLPPNLNVIGNEAFARCSKLQQVKIPFSVNLIGNNAFENNIDIDVFLIPSKKLKFNKLYNNLIKNNCNIKSFSVYSNQGGGVKTKKINKKRQTKRKRQSRKRN